MRAAAKTIVAPTALYVRLLGLVYVAAFASLAVQMRGLFGSHGIRPITEYLDTIEHAVAAHRIESSQAYLIAPSVFWLYASDAALTAVPWIGAVAGLLVAGGVLQAPLLLLAWLLYLSICSVGQEFLGFQWDALLLETGFLSIFVAAWKPLTRWRESPQPSPVGVWLLRILLFRLMFASGVVKLTSGDSTWSELRALQVHYETQPIPSWTSFFVHQLPGWFHKLSCVGMFFVELVLPFGIFLPRSFRLIAGAGLAALQLLIAATGNYGYFNFLTFVLCVLLLDDACIPAAVRPDGAGADPLPRPMWTRTLAYASATLWLLLTLEAFLPAFG